MGWRKLGIIYAPDGSKHWSRSHASQPSAIALSDEIVRVFFSTRDAKSRSFISYADFVLEPQPRLIAQAQRPVLAPPAPGHFDSDGIGMGSIVRWGNEARLYYMGWSLCTTCPWRNSIGVAAGNVEEPSFERVFNGPVVPLSAEDPFTLSYPTVLRFGPADWRMWYGSNVFWGAHQEELEHHLKIKTSHDGLDWHRKGKVVLPVSQKDEYIVIRPSILVEDGQYKMWFATRGSHYRIGSAVSPDGENWVRCDEEAGLDISESGWDSEMVCYPSMLNHNGRRYLFYNGNQYGKDGIGLALWDE